jgi:hypothetical protein
LREFVNIYIVLFLVGGIISLLCVLTARLTGFWPLYIIHGMMTLVLLVTSFPLYVMTGCVYGFPRRAVLPMILFMAWSGLFLALPLPVYLGFRDTGLLMSIVHPCLGVVLLVFLRLSGGNTQWLHTRNEFEYTRLLEYRLAVFIAVNVILIVPMLFFYLATSLGLAISHKSHGFAHLGLGGISFEIRTYHYQGKTIHLLPTAHIAPPGFYEKLIDSVPAKNTVVLPEGITDEDNLMGAPLDYTRFVPGMNLEAQDNQTFISNRSTVICDVDLNEFSSETIELINNLTQMALYGKPVDPDMTIGELINELGRYPKMFREEVLEFRNRRLVECMIESMSPHEHVVIPWGLAHMPGIQRDILEMGGTLVEQRGIPFLSWSSGKNESAEEPQIPDR